MDRCTEKRRWLILLLGITALILIGLALPPASPVATAQPPAPETPIGRPTPDWSAPHVPGQLLVKFADASAAGATALAAQTGMSVQSAIPQLGIAVVETAGANSNAELAATAAALEANPAVVWAEPNYTFTLDAVPDDPNFPIQAPYLNRLEMPAAWDFTTGRPEVVIAILDTGVYLGHPDLAANIWTNPLEIPDNGIDDDGNGFIDDVHGWNFAGNNNAVADDHGHGTHVAGIAAARINNMTGIAGMAGRTSIMPVKVFYPPPNVLGTYEDLIRAMIYAADNGARVINMSLGASSYSRGEEAAVDYAWNHGAIVVAAAGNTGRNTYHYPAAHPNAIAVAATDASDNRAGFSTYGDFVDVAAPGASIYSTLMSGSYGYMSGTSMASPHVAGMAGLIFSLNPQLTNAQVRELIEKNVDDLGATGWDPYFGHGRINARKSLAAVAPPPQPSPTPTPHPPLAKWPAGCQDLVTDGSFEVGLGAWQASGAWSVDATQAYTGTQAAHFTGGPNASGFLTRTVTLTQTNALGGASFPHEGTLWFAFRIESKDFGWGSTPQAPYDDWLTAEFRSTDGKLVSSLLRTGNTADSAPGLPWDRYLYRMQPADLQSLGALGVVDLVFTAGNDADAAPTSFWIDGVRLCMTTARRLYLPLVTIIDQPTALAR
ncbi:MAG: S8 family serine peptidase [Anaerolineae bacterium]|jgi:subtilisin family serine protease|nr:S8 family serine peptidase [Anaerolineae bacterium]